MSIIARIVHQHDTLSRWPDQQNANITGESMRKSIQCGRQLPDRPHKVGDGYLRLTLRRKDKAFFRLRPPAVSIASGDLSLLTV
jgi:hypothetical protein